MDNDYMTKTKAGRIEERVYEDSGKFLSYYYKDSETGKRVKSKIILIGKNETKAYFLIPMKDKELAINADFDLDSKVNLNGEAVSLRDLINKT
ncbi:MULTISPECIES: hypothetical protein [Acidiplasma]|jgi:hypothetical protein|nr:MULTISPECIES: hypothetical protein [Acidiplasma]KJE49580.1 hypothetical protein TZ01_00130 [Acidiplasma sp. MBA-1]WMT55874.1 MAG: hypothetical protein RE470_04335 [Acidiplasma sp.]